MFPTVIPGNQIGIAFRLQTGLEFLWNVQKRIHVVTDEFFLLDQGCELLSPAGLQSADNYKTTVRLGFHQRAIHSLIYIA